MSVHAIVLGKSRSSAVLYLTPATTADALDVVVRFANMPAVDVATVFEAHALTPAGDVTTLDRSLQQTTEIYDGRSWSAYSTTSTLLAPTSVIG